MKILVWAFTKTVSLINSVCHFVDEKLSQIRDENGNGEKGIKHPCVNYVLFFKIFHWIQTGKSESILTYGVHRNIIKKLNVTL